MIIHSRCGGIAFHAKERPVINAVLHADDFIFKDGDTPLAGTEIICESCGSGCSPIELEPEGGFLTHGERWKSENKSIDGDEGIDVKWMVIMFAFYLMAVTIGYVLIFG